MGNSANSNFLYIEQYQTPIEFLSDVIFSYQQALDYTHSSTVLKSSNPAIKLSDYKRANRLSISQNHKRGLIILIDSYFNSVVSLMTNTVLYL